MIYQNGGRVLSVDESECVVASEDNIETLEFIVGLKEDDLLATPSELGTGWHGKALGTETVSSAILGVWGLPFLEDSHAEVDENIDIATHVPIPEGGKKATAAFTVCYSASAETKSPGAAYRLISELTGKEGARQWAEKGLELTARKDLADIDYYSEHPRRKKMLDAGEWSNVVQYGQNSEAVENRLNPELEAAMLGEKSPQAALETAQQKINGEVF
jgi:multiple sugar transport system substrate-binding protein